MTDNRIAITRIPSEYFADKVTCMSLDFRRKILMKSKLLQQRFCSSVTHFIDEYISVPV